MKKFEGILICTDLDGTLFRKDKSISSENKDAIKYFKSEGGYFTFITGRMPAYSRTAYETIEPNAPFGCINGGGLFDHRTGEYVWKSEPLDSDFRLLVEEVERRVPQVGIQLSTFYKTYFTRENAAIERFRRLSGLPDLRRSYSDVDEPIAKVIIADMNDDVIARVKACLDAHPLAYKFGFIRSEKTLYEILPKGIDKGTVLMKMAEYLGVDRRKTVAVGDYDNDVSMLMAAGAGIAVANATDEAKRAAKYVTVSNEEHAIAKIISDIESGKIVLK
ncbi:MAG: HAD family phosphatase [Ruminococcaceae bacterium]|nr:HAD family phosphatase [Oscillospiraceae bacterium]